MMELLRDRYSFHTSYDREIVRFMKEELCHISPQKFDYTNVWLGNNQSYKMPDKKSINIGIEQQLCPEVLFNTTLVELDGESLQHLVCSSLTNLDSSIRSKLSSQTLLVGGCTLIQGFEERLSKEVKNISKSYGKSLKYVKTTEEKRQISQWLGASMLAELDQTQSEMITEQEYIEMGAARLSRETK